MNHEKRREKIPGRCDFEHPSDEWMRIDLGTNEYVFYAYACYLEQGHDGDHAYIAHAGGFPVHWHGAS